MCVCLCANTGTLSYINIHMHAHMHTYTHTPTHMHTRSEHTHTNTHEHTHTKTHAHTHTHTHTHTAGGVPLITAEESEDSLSATVDSTSLEGGGAGGVALPSVDPPTPYSEDPLQPPSWKTHANTTKDILEDVRTIKFKCQTSQGVKNVFLQPLLMHACGLCYNLLYSTPNEPGSSCGKQIPISLS